MRAEGGIDRRALLLGGAGLVVGAGGAGAATAALRSAPAAEPHVASAGEELMVEHGVLKRILLAYRAIQSRLVSRASVSPGVVADAAQLISDYIESFHEGLEEAYVFPRVRDQQPALIETLLVQHDRGRHLTAAILTAATGDLTPSAARRSLAAHLGQFVAMYEPHEAWEDTVVYPTLRQVTPQRTLDLLAERFADLENTQFGDAALEQMLGRLGGVEQQLGIGDLSTFTPPPLS